MLVSPDTIQHPARSGRLRTKPNQTRTEMTTNKAAKAAKAPATKTETPNAADKIKGITELNREKHSYDGFSVRTQKSGNTFQKYVSSSAKSRTETTEALRKSAARAEAVSVLGSVNEIVCDKKSWRDGILTASAVKRIAALGFKHKVTPAKPVSNPIAS
jgi:hypothetical protein